MKKMKRSIRVMRQYKLLSLASLAFIVGLLLTAAHQATALHWVLGTVALSATLPLLWAMIEDVRTGSYGIDILAITAIVASVLLGQYWAAIVVVLMLTGGESLEKYAEHRARRELDALLTRAPQKAHLLQGRKVTVVKVSALKVGDKILIKPGELVPVDAIILEGISDFDESSLTGESLPQSKQIGDQILSGSIATDGAITAKALATASDSQYEQIIKLVRSAAASQTPFVRLAERYSIPFTFLAFAIATAVWVVSGQAIRFLEVIIVATPCPLLLAAPIALISGMSRASKYGIIVKTGSALERLAEAKTIAFDKTGTLTRGILVVSDVTSFNSYTQAEVLQWAASLEQSSTHVVAQAVVAAAQLKQLKLAKAKHVKEIAGRGLHAQLKGQEILVGRFSLLEEHGVVMPPTFKQTAIAQTAIYVAAGGQLAGVITFEDELRPESKATLQRLHDLGLRHTMMITGDNESVARTIAKKLGIATVHAEMLPAGKLKVLETVTQRPLVFVGDGVNDAPVLTTADIGIALGARGSAAASESADLVILQDDISRVATAVAIAKRTFKIAKQSILIGIGLSVILMLVFATGKFSPLVGAIVQEVVDVVVIFNALRAHLDSQSIY
ncbi:MAG: heavy metal translocating P-type ATPase [Candidatus Saccharibacteria bacterium]